MKKLILVTMVMLGLVGCGDAVPDSSGEPYVPDDGVYEFGVDLGRLGEECLGSIGVNFEMEAFGRTHADLDAGPVTIDIQPRKLLLCDPLVDPCDEVVLTNYDGEMLIYRQTLTALALTGHDGAELEGGELEVGEHVLEPDYLDGFLFFDFPLFGVDYAKTMRATAHGAGEGDIAVMMGSRLDFIKPECL